MASASPSEQEQPAHRAGAATADVADGYKELLRLAFGELQRSTPLPPPDAASPDESLLEEPDSEATPDATDVASTGFARYRNAINRIALLNPHLEVELAQAIEAGLLAAAALDRPQSAAIVSDLKFLVSMGSSAHEQFIAANLRLVVYWAERSFRHGLTLEDAVQEGNLGLLKAIQMYDYRKGNKFSTYASWWIRQHIARAAADTSRTVRLPVHVHERVVRLRRAMAAGGEAAIPSKAALNAAGVDPQEAADLLGWSRPLWSLDCLVEEGFLVDLAEQPDVTGDPDSYAERTLLRQTVAKSLEALSQREREVLQMRFGLIDGDPKTLEQVGMHFGLTRERIRQIEAKAKAKLESQTALRAASAEYGWFSLFHRQP